MKRILIGMFLITILISFNACGHSKSDPTANTPTDNPINSTASEPGNSDNMLVYDSVDAFTFDTVDGGIIITQFKNYDYIEYDKIIIPSEINGARVVGIGSKERTYNVMHAVFGSCEVVIPDTVEYIGIGAFDASFGLVKLSGGKNVKEICDSAFRSCSKLESIEFIDTVSVIAENAFVGCTAWEESHS